MRNRVAIGAPRLAWEEAPRRELVRLAVPMVSSLLLTTLVGAFDTWLVGGLGASALAAAGLGNVLAFTIASFSLALFAAAKVKVGELIGRGSFDDLGPSRRAYLKLGFVLGSIGVVLAFVLAEVLALTSRDPNVAELGRSYLRIRGVGVLPMVATAALSHHRQAEGAPRLPMQATLVATCLHVPLSFVLSRTTLGPLGVASAFVVSRSIECGFLGTRLLPELREGLGLAPLRLSPIFRAGLTTAIERLLDMAAFALVPLILARESAEAVAAHQITLQLSQLSFLPLVALSEAVSILVAQTVGGRAPRLARVVAADGYRATIVYATILATCFVTTPAPLARIFSSDAPVVAASLGSLRAAGVLQVVNAAYAVTKGVLRGYSRFDLVAWVAVACAWGVTPPLTYYLGVRQGLGAEGAWLSLVVEVLLGLAILLPVALRVLGRRPAPTEG